MVQVGIYHLIDPRNQEVFYVGCSHDPKGRYKAHIGSRGDNPLVKRIDELLELGLAPLFRVVKWVEAQHGDYEEQSEMARQLALGNHLLQKRGTKNQVPPPENVYGYA